MLRVNQRPRRLLACPTGQLLHANPRSETVHQCDCALFEARHKDGKSSHDGRFPLYRDRNTLLADATCVVAFRLCFCLRRWCLAAWVLLQFSQLLSMRCCDLVLNRRGKVGKPQTLGCCRSVCSGNSLIVHLCPCSKSLISTCSCRGTGWTNDAFSTRKGRATRSSFCVVKFEEGT